MAIEDLDLEFEEEGDAKSGGDAVNIDIDLSFSASPEDEVAGAIKGVKSPQAQKKISPQTNKVSNKAGLKVVENGRPIELDLSSGTNSEITNTVTDIRPEGKVSRPKPVKSGPASNLAKQQSGNSQRAGGEVAFLQQQIDQLQNKLSFVQEQANVRVAVAEAEKNYLVEYVSNAKVLDVQITQLLLKINAKSPALKAESQAIKKLLNEFIAKTKK